MQYKGTRGQLEASAKKLSDFAYVALVSIPTPLLGPFRTYLAEHAKPEYKQLEMRQASPAEYWRAFITSEEYSDALTACEYIDLLSIIVGKDAPAAAVKLATDHWPNYDTDPDHGRAVSVYVQGYKAAESTLTPAAAPAPLTSVVGAATANSVEPAAIQRVLEKWVEVRPGELDDDAVPLFLDELKLAGLQIAPALQSAEQAAPALATFVQQAYAYKSTFPGLPEGYTHDDIDKLYEWANGADDLLRTAPNIQSAAAASIGGGGRPMEVLEVRHAELCAETTEFKGTLGQISHSLTLAGFEQAMKLVAAASIPVVEQPTDLEAGRYLSGYQQSAVARALVKVGKMGLNDTQYLLRDALSRQAGALDTIRAAATAWDETMRAEVESILACCGLHPQNLAAPIGEGVVAAADTWRVDWALLKQTQAEVDKAWEDAKGSTEGTKAFEVAVARRDSWAGHYLHRILKNRAATLPTPPTDEKA